MNKTKIKYKCAVDGNVAIGAICGKISCGSESICMAHGNNRCIYKRSPDWTLEKERAELAK